jgi:error-prone DNA polymerase
VTDHSSRQTVPHFCGATEAPAISAAPLPRLIPGARLVLTDSPIEWLALPRDLAAWSRLTRLLSVGKRRAPKGECHLTRADLAEWGTGMVLIALLPDPMEAGPSPKPDLATMARRFPRDCFLGMPLPDTTVATRLGLIATPRWHRRPACRSSHLVMC